MASSGILMHDAFDPAKIRFGAIEKNNKKKMVPISYEGVTGPQRRILVQTPPVTIPFGLTCNEDMGVIQSYTLNFSFKNHTTDPKMESFLDKMCRMETMLIDQGIEHSADWFGKKMGKELVNEFCKRFVREPKDPKYPPTMRVKIPVSDGEPITEFYDENKNAVKIDYLTKGATVKMIIELTPVWFMGSTSYGVAWRARQIRVMAKPGRLEGYSFVEDNEDDLAVEEEMVEDF